MGPVERMLSVPPRWFTPSPTESMSAINSLGSDEDMMGPLPLLPAPLLPNRIVASVISTHVFQHYSSLSNHFMTDRQSSHLSPHRLQHSFVIITLRNSHHSSLPSISQVKL